MRIISFAHTTPAVLAGAKTVTRRQWTAKTAAGFKAGDLVQAYDKSPRNGGQRVGTIRLTADPVLEAIAAMPDSDYSAEGFAWLFSQDVAALGSIALDDSIYSPQNWRNHPAWQGAEEVWVVRFELVPA